MDYKNSYYEKYKRNVYSENGEDGVIENILKQLKIDSGWVCEFGAWDGKVGSNTFNLVNKGFNAVYIEADTNKFKDLLKTAEQFPIIPINRMVGVSQNSLDEILGETSIPKDFAVLSIDVDGFDYDIWESLKNYNPIIVVIEIDSSINPMYDTVYHPQLDGVGTSFTAVLNLGKSKNYSFLLHTANMIFIRNDYFDLLKIKHPHNPISNFRRDFLKNQDFLSEFEKHCKI